MSPLTSDVIGPADPDLRELLSGPQIDVSVAVDRRLVRLLAPLLALLLALLALQVALDGSEPDDGREPVQAAGTVRVDRVQRLGHEPIVAAHWASASDSAATCALSALDARSAASRWALRMRSL